MIELAMIPHVLTHVALHSVVEDGAATQQQTAEVWTIRQNARVLRAQRGSQEQEEHAGLPPTEDHLASLEGTEQDVAPVVQTLDQIADPCVTLTHVDKMQIAILDRTILEKQDLSALAHVATLAMLLLLAGGGNVSGTMNVRIIWHVLTINVKTHARDQTHHVEQMPSAR